MIFRENGWTLKRQVRGRNDGDSLSAVLSPSCLLPCDQSQPSLVDGTPQYVCVGGSLWQLSSFRVICLQVDKGGSD